MMKRVLWLSLLMWLLVALPVAGGASEGSECLRDQIEALLEQSKSRGWLGFYYRLIGSAPGELEVIYVYSQGPAEEAGLRLGDRIIGIAGLTFDSKDPRVSERQFRLATKSVHPGERVSLQLLRNDVAQDIEIHAASLEAHALSEFIGRELLVRYGEQKRRARSSNRH